MPSLDSGFGLLIHPRVFVVAAGIFVLLRWLSATRLGQVAVYKRTLPLLPELLGVVAMVLGAAPEPDAPLLVNALIGIWSGYVAAKFRKIIGQTVLGDDRAIEVAKAPALVHAIKSSLPPPQAAEEGE